MRSHRFKIVLQGSLFVEHKWQLRIFRIQTHAFSIYLHKYINIFSFCHIFPISQLNSTRLNWCVCSFIVCGNRLIYFYFIAFCHIVCFVLCVVYRISYIVSRSSVQGCFNNQHFIYFSTVFQQHNRIPFIAIPLTVLILIVLFSSLNCCINLVYRLPLISRVKSNKKSWKLWNTHKIIRIIRWKLMRERERAMDGLCAVWCYAM